MTIPIELDPEEKGNSMSKPSDIPQDVWDAAVEAMAASQDYVEEYQNWDIRAAIPIARAILAERERAAKIAEAAKLNDTAERLNNPRSIDPGWQHTADLHEQGAVVAELIAAAIRKGTP